RRTDGKVAGFSSIVCRGRASQRENLQACQLRLNVSYIFPFCPSYVSNRAKHNGCRDREFHNQTGQTKGSAGGSRSYRSNSVKTIASSCSRSDFERTNGHLEGLIQGSSNGFMNGLRPAFGQQVKSFFEWHP